MKYFLFLILLLPATTFGAEPTWLIEIPKLGNSTEPATFSTYINFLYLTAISLAALLAVIKIIIAGVKYMLTDIVTSKSDAIKEIRGAIFGLLIILGAFLILNTINPSLTNSSVGFKSLAEPDFKLDPPPVAPAPAPGGGTPAPGGGTPAPGGGTPAPGNPTSNNACGITVTSDNLYTYHTAETSGCAAAGISPATMLGQLSRDCTGTGKTLTRNGTRTTCAVLKNKNSILAITPTQRKATHTLDINSYSGRSMTVKQEAAIDDCSAKGRYGKYTISGNTLTCKIPTIIPISPSQSSECTQLGGKYDINLFSSNECILY